ncbi:hypothetical protein BDFG_01246 [Blastomyces dermatitidis ATCC 26199]|nr:hypothetical protein BDFG_01246 [Blastomyces dermatitidis ATCC 26199]
MLRPSKSGSGQRPMARKFSHTGNVRDDGAIDKTAAHESHLLVKSHRCYHEAVSLIKHVSPAQFQVQAENLSRSWDSWLVVAGWLAMPLRPNPCWPYFPQHRAAGFSNDRIVK